jgi:hypothetical protein
MSPATLSPVALTWGQYIEQLIAERGGLAELARCLAEVAPAGLPDDPQTIERGIRRLRGRGHLPGEKYGRLLIRCMGIPSPIAAQARELGQYHSRLSDLPVPTRRDQLRLWDRPPVSESPLAAWIHIGLASLAHRSLDAAVIDRRLVLARLVVRAAGPDAGLELALMEARLLSDRKLREEATARLDAAEALLGDTALTADDAACYFARLQDQRAYLAGRAWAKDRSVLADALALYQSIPLEGAPPFAAFRRAHGEGWCMWRLGQPEEGLRHARLAEQHAGDGGLIRMRIMALTLQGHILASSGGDPEPVQARARRLAARLDDAQLTRSAGGS